jgi:hypothetical protein
MGCALFLYPFVLGRGHRFFEEIDLTKHLALSDVKRFTSGTVVLEYTREKSHVEK